MKLHRLSFTLLLLLLLSACTMSASKPTPTATSAPTPVAVSTPAPTPTQAPVDFAVFRRQVCDARKAIYATDVQLDASQWMIDYPDEENPFTETEMTGLLTPHPATADFNLQAAKEDVETFFLLLKTTYGAYDYFGGDKVFLPLKDKVLADLEAAPGPFVRTLEDVLVDALAPVLIDGHFSIGYTGLSQRFKTAMYYVPDLYFADPAQVGPQSAPYLKPTIAPDGSIQYWYAALSRDGSDLPKSLDSNALEWQRAGWQSNDWSFVFRESNGAGIPTMVSRLMSASGDAQEAELDRFASCGGEYADKPLFMLDVRANPGGSDNWIMGWFEGFAGRPADRRGAGGHKYSPLLVRINDDYARFPERFGRWTNWSSEGTWTENDSMVFVLTDKGTASSGETAVRFMRTVDNTIFVGGPTMGCALVPNNIHFYLPHSGLEVYFGTGLSFCETLENRDGVGLLPDLWVEPTEADAAVARLCDYYKLPTSH